MNAKFLFLLSYHPRFTRENAGGEKTSYVVTDGLQAYHKAFNKEFYTNYKPQTKHNRCARFIGEDEQQQGKAFARNGKRAGEGNEGDAKR